MLLLGLNHFLIYVPLGVIAKNLPRAISVMQEKSEKDLGLVPAGLRIKSPLNMKEALCIVKATCKKLIRARINDCHRRLNNTNDTLVLFRSKLKELIPTPLLNTLTIIADKRANETTEQHHAIVQSKLTRLEHAAHKKRHKTDRNWVRNISPRPLDENETQVLSYGLNTYQPTEC